MWVASECLKTAFRYSGSSNFVQRTSMSGPQVIRVFLFYLQFYEYWEFGYTAHLTLKKFTKLFYKYKAIYQPFDIVNLKQGYDSNAADIQKL